MKPRLAKEFLWDAESKEVIFCKEEGGDLIHLAHVPAELLKFVNNWVQEALSEEPVFDTSRPDLNVKYQ